MQIDGVKRIDANDLDETAAAAVRRNLEYNDPKASGLVRPTQGDVRLMALQVQRLDVALLFRHVSSKGTSAETRLAQVQ